jgi:predicted TIM-barrel fold metal-dependent hydrolase
MPSADDLIESMDASGVDMAVIAGWPWKDMGLCRAHNDFLADLCRNSPRLHWLGIVNPHCADAVGEIQRIREMGARGVGEVNADAQGFTWDTPSARLREVAAVCTELEFPMMAHVSEPVGRSYPGKGTATPQRILAFIMQFPELRFVAAHWGGGLAFYELMPDLSPQLANVYYDSAASTYLYRADVFDIVTRIVGMDRVIWGSDYPILGQRRFLAMVRDHAPVDGLSQITGGNALRVYGIDGSGDRP